MITELKITHDKESIRLTKPDVVGLKLKKWGTSEVMLTLTDEHGKDLKDAPYVALLYLKDGKVTMKLERYVNPDYVNVSSNVILVESNKGG